MLSIFSIESGIEKQIFYSESKWLHPIFEFETFLETYDGPRDNLTAWDSAIGKAAAVLLIRLGIKKLHGELVSELAVKYVDSVLGGGKTDPLFGAETVLDVDVADELLHVGIELPGVLHVHQGVPLGTVEVEYRIAGVEDQLESGDVFDELKRMFPGLAAVVVAVLVEIFDA